MPTDPTVPMGTALWSCRACGNAPQESNFTAPSNSFMAQAKWTRIECRGHPYVSVQVEAETRGEAAQVWNAIMGEPNG